MTIYALSSGPGISGVAIIRVSGAETLLVIKSLTGKTAPKPRVATLRKINKIGTSKPSTRLLEMRPKCIQRCKNTFGGSSFAAPKLIFPIRLWYVFPRFYLFIGVPGETCLRTLLPNISDFVKKWNLHLLHTLTAFWLDVQGLGLPGGLKTEEKSE